ncbi:YaeQ family protein [Marinobacterium nitratireducens]|uniref:YaeQ family protein n=1 Tax=Marinobacterium nitratireducens TaxID=518897 RepID=UPI001666B974|nr:YaeQ family protein [Marinobacterium nitratireducens]
MALKPTIYKIRIALSDLNRDYYDNLALTVAQHPSENLQRMMARILSYSLNASAELAFTKGLSSTEEPDIWARTLDDKIALWIEVGEPAPERIKKATRLAGNVKVYSFNSKSDVWWEQGRSKFAQLDAEFYRFRPEQIEALSQLVERTMDFSITLSGTSAYVSAPSGTVEVEWECLQGER